MNLIVDIGNTRIKSALYSNKKLVGIEVHETGNKEKLDTIIASNKADTIIVSTVINLEDSFYAVDPAIKLIRLDSSTPLPFINRYASLTLGPDRMAAAAGAQAAFPRENVLSIDCGTCIKYDFINEKGEYLGGAISPGINMRLQALHTFTGRLPLLQPEEAPLTGSTTQKSILSGVINGSRFEVMAAIREYEKKYPGIRVILTGGDSKYFESPLKSNIFVFPNLVLSGLNEILDYNVNNNF